ncbi:MAG TPA: serpin family protein [Opitutaceae bacterium]|nr:serpin family protein [Opitutaceae bacterium]
MRLRLALPSCLLIATFAGAAEFDAASATNQVGLDLFRRLAPQKQQSNLVLSPYSIASALALVYAGADGTTRAEMARALHFASDDQSMQAGFATLRASLDQIAAQSKNIAAGRQRIGGRLDVIEWHAANRLFGQQGYAFRDAFLALMKNGYAAPFEPLDFRRAAEPGRATINAWVEEQTRGKIRDLIPRGSIKPDTRLVLVNALYLKAPWSKHFEERETRPRPFHVGGADQTQEIPTMHDVRFGGYVEEDGLTVVTLDYIGGGLQFLIVLPAEGKSVDEVADRVTPADFARWSKLGQDRRQSLSLFLPRFRAESATLPLGAALEDIGVKSAFDVPSGSANFERIAPRKPSDYLALDEVFHRAFVVVDEEGTEAAAATAATMVTLAAIAEPPPPIEVRVDRPFLFAIQHRASGTCLFLGRIVDPR